MGVRIFYEASLNPLWPAWGGRGRGVLIENVEKSASLSANAKFSGADFDPGKIRVYSISMKYTTFFLTLFFDYLRKKSKKMSEIFRSKIGEN